MYVVKFERYFEDHSNVYMVLELCSNNVSKGEEESTDVK